MSATASFLVMPTSSGNSHPDLKTAMCEEVRRRQIARRWPRFHWDDEGRARRYLWAPRHFLNPIAGASLFGIVYLEAALWWNGLASWWPFEPLRRSPESRILLVTCAFLLNAWLLDRFLADQTKIELEVPAWVRGLRFAASGVPVLGLLVLPAWRWITVERPGWLRRKNRAPALDPRALRSSSLPNSWRIETWRRAASQSPVLLISWLIATQILAYLAILSWLAAGPFDSGRRWVLIGACGLLHLTVYGCVADYTRRRRPRAPRWAAPLLRYGPLLLFLPSPFTCLGILIWLPATEEEREEKTLIHHAYTQRNQPLRPDLQTRPADSLRSVWQTVQQIRKEVDETLQTFFGNPSEAGGWETGRLAFYRLKTFFLVLDVAALAWIVTRLGWPVLTLESPSSMLAVFLVMAALGLLVEVAFLGMRVVGWLQRRVPAYFPYGRYIVLTQLALPIGLLAGTQIALGDGHGLGLVLWAAGLVSAVLALLVLAPISFFFSLPGRDTVTVLAWASLSFELFLVGVILRAHPELSPPFLALFRFALALTLLWSAGLFFALGRRLLQPFELRHIFKPGLPAGVRMVLAFLLVTAALPLGGVTIPFWIYARHRCWPRYESLLAGLPTTLNMP
jgi:hypothetical protein